MFLERQVEDSNLVEDLYFELNRHSKYKDILIKNEKGEFVLNREYIDLWENSKNITPDKINK